MATAACRWCWNEREIVPQMPLTCRHCGKDTTWVTGLPDMKRRPTAYGLTIFDARFLRALEIDAEIVLHDDHLGAVET